MCGIFAAHLCCHPTKEVFHNAMLHLRYRGYDSWGFSFPNSNVRSLSAYKDEILKVQGEVNTGMIHTRWATNGEVCLQNAHPIMKEGYVMVHNGILTNHKEYDGQFTPRSTETDTEVLLNLFIDNRLCDAEGDFAFVVKVPWGRYKAYRKGSTPLYAAMTRFPGEGSVSNFFTSDLQALPPGEYSYTLIPEGEQYDLEDLYFRQSELLDKIVITDTAAASETECVTLAELRESPDVLKELNKLPKTVCRLKSDTVFVGSGSSYNAALFAQYLTRNGKAVIPNDYNGGIHSSVFISQSGESHDILEASKKALTFPNIIVTNNTQSSLAKMNMALVSDIQCGVERAVGATKSFIATCYVLANLAGRTLDHMFNPGWIEPHAHGLLPSILTSKRLFILGSGYNYPIALEAALKFKELALVYAEGFQTTEFKHGPLALTDRDSLAIIIGQGHKELVAAEQIKARGGQVVYVNNGNPLADIYEVQYLAIKTALAKGINPDFPRNLAKSITVE